jgi:hypothetical protein
MLRKIMFPVCGENGRAVNQDSLSFIDVKKLVYYVKQWILVTRSMLPDRVTHENYYGDKLFVHPTLYFIKQDPLFPNALNLFKICRIDCEMENSREKFRNMFLQHPDQFESLQSLSSQLRCFRLQRKSMLSSIKFTEEDVRWWPIYINQLLIDMFSQLQQELCCDYVLK